jgi:hypothetical protein
MIAIKITIDGAQFQCECDATLASPLNERKFAAILLAVYDATAAALSANDGTETTEYKAVVNLIGQKYLPHRTAEMTGSQN